MKTLNTIKINNQYSTSTFTGTTKEVANFLRTEAKLKRRESRLRAKLNDSVTALPSHLHQSKLVTMASFALNSLDAKSLMTLLNNHGVVKYSF
jgi:phage host-nuclease inhibitor protein Gam